MARSRTDAVPRHLIAALLAGALLLGGCGGGAAAEPGPLEPIAATGVAPGSGTLMPEGHRETDTDIDTWVAPDSTSGGWYAFPLPSGFAATTPPEGTELLVLSMRGQARTVLSVTRLPREGRLSIEVAVAAVASGGRQLLGDAQERTVDGLPAVTVDALDTSGEPVMTVRQILVDIGPDRLVLTITTDADPADLELGLVEAVAVDNLFTRVLD